MALNCNAKEIIVKIDGEEYTKDYPKTYEEAIETLETVVEMEITADDRVVELEKKYTELMVKYNDTLSKLESDLNDVKDTSNKIDEDLKTTEKVINNYVKTNTRFMMGAILGPKIGISDSVSVGTNVELIGIYRIFRNFHIGGSMFCSIINASEKRVDAGAGLILGYSIK